jgi:hypothetical protein
LFGATVDGEQRQGAVILSQFVFHPLEADVTGRSLLLA